VARNGATNGTWRRRRPRPTERRPAILVTSYPGQLTADDLDREAGLGATPRTDYVELARELGAVIIDHTYLQERATPVSRALRGLDDGKQQIAEVLARSGRFGPLVVWNEKVALLLASVFKLARSRRDLVVISVAMSTPRRSFLLKHLHVHSHVSAIVTYGTAQYEIAAGRLAVPREKLHVVPAHVDERFWRPQPVEQDNTLCNTLCSVVGWEGRDYRTLLRAVEGLPLEVQIAIGSTVPVQAKETVAGLLKTGVPGNVSFVWPNKQGLRELYGRSSFVVIPRHDLEYETASGTLLEAMAMEKAVIMSRTRGGMDILRDRREGIYVPPADPRALREAIVRLAGDPELARTMGRAGERRSSSATAWTLSSAISRRSWAEWTNVEPVCGQPIELAPELFLFLGCETSPDE
jgi:hypothetical protein